MLVLWQVGMHVRLTRWGEFFVTYVVWRLQERQVLAGHTWGPLWLGPKHSLANLFSPSLPSSMTSSPLAIHFAPQPNVGHVTPLAVYCF